MKKAVVLLLAALVTLSAFVFTIPAKAAEADVISAMGQPNADSTFVMDITAPENYKAGSSFEVTVKLTDFKAKNGFLAVMFNLHYDNYRLTLANKNNADGSVECLPKVDEHWENLSTVAMDSDGNKYIKVAVGCATKIQNVVNADGMLEFRFNFDAKLTADGAAPIYIDHASVKGFDADFNLYRGSGDYVMPDTRLTMQDCKQDFLKKMGNAPTDSALDVTFNLPESKRYNNEVFDVTISITGLDVNSDFNSVQFELYYDDLNLQLSSPIGKGNKVACLKDSPDDSWVDNSIVSATAGGRRFVIVSVAIGETEAYLPKNGTLTFELSFSVKANAVGATGLYIPHAGIVATDKNGGKHFGSGSYTLIDVKAPSIQLKDASGFVLDIEAATVKGKECDLTAADFANKFNGTVKLFKNGNELKSSDKVGTGVTLQSGGVTVTVIISGDLNGDGKRSSTDYLMLKRAVLGTYTLEGAFLGASYINADEKLAAADYLMLKRIVLGTYEY